MRVKISCEVEEIAAISELAKDGVLRYVFRINMLDNDKILTFYHYTNYTDRNKDHSDHKRSMIARQLRYKHKALWNHAHLVDEGM